MHGDIGEGADLGLWLRRSKGTRDAAQLDGRLR
jgi:hypothetical protein